MLSKIQLRIIALTQDPILCVGVVSNYYVPCKTFNYYLAGTLGSIVPYALSPGLTSR